MAAPPKRWLAWAASSPGSPLGLAGVLRRAPLTMAFIAVLWVVGAATRSLVNGPSARLMAAVAVGPDALAQGRWWTPLTSAAWCADLGGYLTASVLLLIFAAPAERRLGAGRVGLLLFLAQVTGTVIGSGAVWLASIAGDQWAGQIAHGLFVGPGGAAVGVAMAFSCRMSTLWRRRVRLLLLLGSALLVAYSGALADVCRLVAALGGLLIGPLLLGRARAPAHHITSRTERRVLVALVVATLALGPVIAAVSDTAIGPLSVLRYLVLVPPPTAGTVQRICLDPATADDCRALRAQLNLSGLGPTIMTLLPVLLLLISAEGLRRGRRAAWWVALLVNGALTALAMFMAAQLFGIPEDQLVAFGGLSRTLSVEAILLPLAVPALVAALLLLTRSSFDVPAPRGTYRRLTAVLLTTVLAVSTVFVIGSAALHSDFDRQPTVADLLLALPTRFIPPAYLTEIDPRFLPTRPLATVLYEWPGVLVLLVLASGLAVSFRRNRAGTLTGDHARARALLINQGGSSFSYMTLWHGNSYWFTPDGRGYVAFRVVGNVAVTTGDPVGAPDDVRATVAGFARFCADRGLTGCLYAVTTAIRDVAERDLEWRSVQVAEETVVPLAGLTFTGKKWQDIRSAVNRAARNSITAQWINYPHAPLSITEQIAAISEQWVADKGLPEMGFTLGGLDQLDDDKVRCLVAIDDSRTVHAVTSWLPVYRDGRPVAWTLDFMRRRPGCLPGVIEFLIASAAQDLRAQGAEYLSLSGAPLARVDRDITADPLQRFLDVLSRTLEPVYGFRSLLDFKAKFQPEYVPRWMVYPDAVAVPAIANAITRCYLPDLTTRQATGLVRKLRKQGAR